MSSSRFLCIARGAGRAVVTGQTVNTWTLGGLALAIGILVDESTVAIENIHTHLTRGESIKSAVLEATHETITPRLLAMLSGIGGLRAVVLHDRRGAIIIHPLSLAVGFAMLASYLL